MEYGSAGLPRLWLAHVNNNNNNNNIAPYSHNFRGAGVDVSSMAHVPPFHQSRLDYSGNLDYVTEGLV